MPIDYKLYPPNWKSEIRPAILKRAENKCEQCGVGNGTYIIRSVDFTTYYDGIKDEHFRYPSGAVITERLESMTPDSAMGEKWVKIVLTIAHANHNIQDNEESNLFAWCQLCHLRHDAKHHAQNAAKTRLDKKAAGSLFEETANV